MTAELTREDIEQVVARIQERERRSRSRVLLYTGIPVVLALIVLGFTGALLHRWQRELADLKVELTNNRNENEVAKTRIKELERERQDLQRRYEKLQGRYENSVRALPVVQEAIKEFHKGHYDAALKLYDGALGWDPHNSYVLDLRGYALMRAGRVPEAIASLEQSVSIDPQYARGYLNLTKAYCQAKDGVNATRTKNLAVALDQTMKLTMKGDNEFKNLCRGHVVLE